MPVSPEGFWFALPLPTGASSALRRRLDILAISDLRDDWLFVPATKRGSKAIPAAIEPFFVRVFSPRS
jgi:hypothetical protein